MCVYLYYMYIHLVIDIYRHVIPHWILIHHSSDLHFSPSLSTIATASSRLGDIEAALEPGWAEPGDDSCKMPRAMVVDGPRTYPLELVKEMLMGSPETHLGKKNVYF